MTLRKLFFSVLFFLIPCFFFPEQAEPEGSRLSLFVEQELFKNGLRAERETLSKTGHDIFAYNVRSKITDKRARSAQKEEAGFSDSQGVRDVIVLCFTQEDFFRHSKKIISLLKYIKEKDYGFAVHALFSALDGNERFATGSSVFARNFEEQTSACAILFSFSNGKPASVQNGSRRSVTPLWLYERVVSSLKKSGTAFLSPGNMLSLYKIGLIDGEKRMDAFSRSGIPSVFISFKNEEELEAVKNFLDSYTVLGTDTHDRHYFYIPFPRGFFIGEKAIVRLVLLVGTLSLLLLCAFTFSGKYGAKVKKHFLRTIYFLPLMFVFYLGSLYLGQLIAQKAGAALALSPASRLSVKFLVAILTIIAISFLFARMNLPIHRFVFGHTVDFVAVTNIFIFLSFDILLFIPFSIEFIIIYTFRKVRKLPLILIPIILLLVPFGPYAKTLLRSAGTETISMLASSTLKENFLLSLGFFPFMIHIQKTFLGISIFAREKGYSPAKKVLRIFLPATAALVVSFILISIALNKNYKTGIFSSSRKEISIEDEECRNLSAKIIKSEFQGVLSNHLSISSDKNALRYSVSVEAPGEVSVYDSFYGFFSDGGRTMFIIPDFPPQKITIDFTSPQRPDMKIIISAIYKTEFENKFVRQSIYIDQNIPSH